MQNHASFEPLPSSLADQTLARLEEAMNTGQNHCLPELMEIIHALSAKATEISVEQLGDLIEKHVAVMARVISAANTFGYNPTNADINTVGEAIQVIGFERIRSLVTSLILVRHAADSADTREQRATALLAVSSGLIARTLAREHELVDPELAFVSSSLRQLGRLLLVAYLTDEYRVALKRSEEIGDNAAFVEQFGLTPLALTHEILRRAHFPTRLLDALHEYQRKPAGRRSPEAQSLISISSFSEELCKLALDRDLDEEDFHEELATLSKHYDNRLSFEPDYLGGALADMGDKLAQFTGSMGFGNVANELVSTMRWRGGRGPSLTTPASNKSAKAPAAPANTPTAKTTGTDSATRPGTPTPQPATTPKTNGPSTPSVNTVQASGSAGTSTVAPSSDPNKLPLTNPGSTAEELDIRSKHWRDGLVSLTAFLSEPSIDMGSMHSLALDFVRQGFCAPEAILLRVDSDQRSFVATNGVGPVFKRIRGDKAIRKDERTVFGIAMSRRENVVIHNTSDPKITPYLPAWCSSVGGWGAFVAIPVCDQVACFALMLIAWPAPTQIIINPENAKLLRSLLTTIGAARRLSQN